MFCSLEGDFFKFCGLLRIFELYAGFEVVFFISLEWFFLGKDTCRGDSGGPLVLKLGQYKTYYQMGIVSFGFEGICGNGRPAIYTRLASYLEWIQASLEPWFMQMATRSLLL